MPKSTCRYCSEGWPLITLASGERVHEIRERGLATCFATPKPDTIPLVYIMSPYTDPDSITREQRYLNVRHYERTLTVKFPSALFYSPIVHFHPIAIANNLPRDVGYWREKNRCMIHRSQLGVVLRISGWMISKGVSWERELFDILNIPYVLEDQNTEHEVVGQALQELA